MGKHSYTPPAFADRQAELAACRNLKMARSAHAYVRGNTVRFYEWLEAAPTGALPDGPPVWICGDCHIGNLGPLANAHGDIDVQIRDLDQTVIGNPAHDMIRLGLSLATAARGSDLPGIITAKMLEQMMEGYEEAFAADPEQSPHPSLRPECVQIVMRRAMRRSWKHLARERIADTTPTIPLGRRFWPLSAEERQEINGMFETESVRRLLTLLRSRENDAPVEILDAAHWVKGCSSLGRLRFAVLAQVGNRAGKDRNFCLVDVKEAIKAAAPHDSEARMPRDNAERVVAGAGHLSPHLGERMRAARLLGRSVFLRELRPQDLKLEIEQLTHDEATKAARYLAQIVGQAHARQMDSATRRNWLREMRRDRTKSLDAPSWLWTSIVALMADHEAGYLEHCRTYALQAAQDGNHPRKAARPRAARHRRRVPPAAPSSTKRAHIRGTHP
jgi:uncharacterized protein (DUF2252 family)